MQYLESFALPSEDDELAFILSMSEPRMNMQCYRQDSTYPFRIFPKKQLRRIQFAPITVFYGDNGSGKSTLLNVIAEKLSISRYSPFNHTPFFPDYLKRCRAYLSFDRKVPSGSRYIASDEVFDQLLALRGINDGIDEETERLFDEYRKLREEPAHLLQSLDDVEAVRQCQEARRRTKSDYVTRRIPINIRSASNGETAYLYFTQLIHEHALYLLDEPENSLSPKWQQELAAYIGDSARFYHCQFVLATHSPFFLGIPGAQVWDLDSVPAKIRPFTELENIRVYYDFFMKHRDAMEGGENCR